jgi:hypothetical protein
MQQADRRAQLVPGQQQASITTVGLCRPDMSHPTMRQECKSSTTATFSQPARVGTKVAGRLPLYNS